MLKKTQALQQICFLYKEIPIKDNICLVLIHVHGKHCVPCCLSFFLQTLQNPLKSKVWSANDVDNVLIVGNYLYKCSIDAMGRQYDYLLVRDLPNYLTLQNKAYSWKVRKTYFGNISENYMGEYSLLRLEFVLSMSLSQDKYAIFVCKGNAINLKTLNRNIKKAGWSWPFLVDLYFLKKGSLYKHSGN